MQRLVVFQELGILPTGTVATRDGKMDEKEGATPTLATTSMGVLFSGQGDVTENDCDVLRKHDFANSQVALTLFKERGGDWKRLAELAEAHWANQGSVRDAARVEALQLMRVLQCAQYK